MSQNYGIKNISTIDVVLYGSLAKTGKGHGTDKAVMMGLMGYEVESFKPELLNQNIETISKNKKINFNEKDKFLLIHEKTLFLIITKKL